jgi:hypothetical protein
MSPPRSSILTSNLDLYKFHRPKLRVHDTPYPLKRESELYNPTLTCSIQPLPFRFPDPSRTSRRIVQSVQLRHIHAHVVLLYLWHCSSGGQATFTFYSASKLPFSTLAVYPIADLTKIDEPKPLRHMLVTPHSLEEGSMTRIRRSRIPLCVSIACIHFVKLIVTGLSSRDEKHSRRS